MQRGAQIGRGSRAMGQKWEELGGRAGGNEPWCISQRMSEAPDDGHSGSESIKSGLKHPRVLQVNKGGVTCPLGFHGNQPPPKH